MLPCHALASPLSPQPSSLGTPRLGPAIKVWDPYNVLAPPPQLPPPPLFTRSFSSSSIDDDRVVMEVFLISHGECELNLRSDLVGGRCPEAGLTPKGKRQGRALAVFLKSQGVRFNAVYTSPLDRARSMAISVCQVINSVALCLSTVCQMSSEAFVSVLTYDWIEVTWFVNLLFILCLNLIEILVRTNEANSLWRFYNKLAIWGMGWAVLCP